MGNELAGVRSHGASHGEIDAQGRRKFGAVARPAAFIPFLVDAIPEPN